MRFKDFILLIGLLQVTCANVTQVDVVPNENVRPEAWKNVDDRVKKSKKQSRENLKVSYIFDADTEEHYRYIESVMGPRKWRVQHSPIVDRCRSEPHINNLGSDAFSSGSSTKSLPASLNEKKNNGHHRSNTKLEKLQVTVDIINNSDGSNHLIKASAETLINRSSVDVSIPQQVMPRGM